LKDENFKGSIFEKLGFDAELCPICGAHLRNGICLNGCHLNPSAKELFRELMEKTKRNLKEASKTLLKHNLKTFPKRGFSRKYLIWKELFEAELRQLNWKKIQKTLFSRTLAKYRYLLGDVKRETDFEAGFMAGFHEAIRIVLGEEASK